MSMLRRKEESPLYDDIKEIFEKIHHYFWYCTIAVMLTFNLFKVTDYSAFDISAVALLLSSSMIDTVEVLATAVYKILSVIIFCQVDRTLWNMDPDIWKRHWGKKDENAGS